MPNDVYVEDFKKYFSKFTTISEEKVEYMTANNNIATIMEHPGKFDLSRKQLEKIHQLQDLEKLYNRIEFSKDIEYTQPKDLAKYLDTFLPSKYDKEHMLVGYLNEENKITEVDVISTGILNASLIHPREVFKKALIYNSKGIVLGHNHPSGNSLPSKEDLNVTKRIEGVGELLNIKLVDHVILGRNEYTSLIERGFVDGGNYTFKIKQHTKDEKQQFINRANELTNINKTTLKKVLKAGTIEEAIDNYKDFDLSLEEKTGLQDLINLYGNIRVNKENYKRNIQKITTPSDIVDYFDFKYQEETNYTAVGFLDTKNQIIDSINLPNNLDSIQRDEFIIKEAIKNDSSSIIMAQKKESLSPTTVDKLETKNLINKLELVGIPMLDSVISNERDFFSYKGEGLMMKEKETPYNSFNDSEKDQVAKDNNANKLKRQFAFSRQVER